ncbi:unnamed protein product [Didymodactylos carnosus]|uniref:DUF4246 domain-containing protein n=1 Tax=Didymodactylos carnosus TaxID=1234261 RepID=A0A8S2ICM9_9BILA|nr:unnamed protein product [Didymodactylos carnosus]CAF3740755.1 unnamed protein product [Didymodactylos carnosus]
MASNISCSKNARDRVYVSNFSALVGQWIQISHDNNDNKNEEYDIYSNDYWNNLYHNNPEIHVPCQIYVVDYSTIDHKIKGWLKEDEVDLSNDQQPWNAYFDISESHYQTMKPAWVCKWLALEREWIIELILDNAVLPEKPDFYRLAGDRYVTYGDGGSSSLVYPVWINEHLSISESRRQRLTQALYTLNEQRQDFHQEPSPVEDIIDPDLLPNCPPSFDRQKWIEQQQDKLKNNEYNLRHFKRNLANGEYNDLSKHVKLRETYQWLPSEFVLTKSNGKVDILSPIHHLPIIPENRQIYGDIATIFSKMIPMFEKMGLIGYKQDEDETKLQVIVKAQSYNMKSGMRRTVVI